MEIHIVLFVVRCWSGSRMVDNESISLIEKILGTQKTRTGLSINAIITAIILVIFNLIHFFLGTESEVGKGIASFLGYFIFYAISNLLSLAYLITTKSFITPEVKHINCARCQNSMSTIKLRCTKCGWEAGEKI